MTRISSRALLLSAVLLLSFHPSYAFLGFLGDFVEGIVCIGASLFGGGCGGGSETVVVGNDNSEEDRRRWCHENCMDHWAPWSACSHRCGGGTQTRSRGLATHGYCDDITCTLPSQESQTCNEYCVAGLPFGGECPCPSTREGDCCEFEITCSYPSSLANGQISGTWPAAVGAVATFQCDEGFSLEGPDTIHCRGNNADSQEDGIGYWSDDTPTCTRVMCQAPEVNDHVELLNRKSGYIFGELTYFRCDDGYELVGPETRECTELGNNEGTWTGFPQTCDPISCPDPGIPLNGDREGDSLTFGAVLVFSCLENFRLIGSTSVSCQTSGTWLGHIPTCEELECDSPYEDDHVSVRILRSGDGVQALFSCDDGYTLDGPETLQCVESGGVVYWDGLEPSCEAIFCDDPGNPQNGYREGLIFSYPNELTYNCFNGYHLQGQPTISCQRDGRWSGEVPVCEACPLNTWADDDNCVACPSDSHTILEGSTSQAQCVCDDGYIGPNGGPCQQVQCTQLLAPDFGEIVSCDTMMGGACNFTCDDGYVLERGSSTRSCQANGVWSGSQPFCSPCPLDTYKSAQRSCTGCPVNSGTAAPAQMLSGCTCNAGYQGPAGGPCTDVDECEPADGGPGPCEDTCNNLPGSYACQCNTPGYEVDPSNTDLCFPEEQCRNLTSEDAPANGGLACHWYHNANSIFCSIRCNPGYEPVGHVNNYETCGPTTGYEWSFIVVYPMTEALPDCAESLFPNDIRYHADIFYLTSNCNDLSEEEITEVLQAFADVLNNAGVCNYESTGFCRLQDSALICHEGRRKRSTDGIESVSFSMDVIATPIVTNFNDCSSDICEFLRIPDYACGELCFTRYRQFVISAMRYSERLLKELFEESGRRKRSTDGLSLTIGGHVFEPDLETAVVTSGVQVLCDPGLVHNDSSCLPCPPGTFHNLNDDECDPCPPGTSQHLSAQTECQTCPTGSTNTGYGNTACYLCTEGSYGFECEETCTCVNGFCDPFDGSCLCVSGWEGENCDIDTSGCGTESCYPGVECHDAPAPSTGFTCGDCPPGYDGDGVSCIAVNAVCIGDTWGAGCLQQCDCLHGGCHAETGVCSCDPGWLGERCTEECPAGTWGENCMHSCHCAHGTCHHVTGVCQCDRAWTGPQCTIAVDHLTQTTPEVPDHSEEQPNGGTACVPYGGLLLLWLTAALAVVTTRVQQNLL